MENTKSNKKLLIVICAIIVIAIVAIICVVVVTNSAYKNQIKELATVMTDTEKMEKFVDEKVNLRAWYALNKIEEDENLDFNDEKAVKNAFEKVYKEAKKSDYESDENKNNVKNFFGMLTMFTSMTGDNAKIEVKDIGKLKDAEDDLKFLKQAEFTLKITAGDNSTEGKWRALFYKNKLIMAAPVDEGNSNEDYDYESDYEGDDTEVDWEYEEEE